MPEGNYTTYQWPLPLSDTTVLVLKTDYDRPSRFVRLDTRTGAEEPVCYTGLVSTRPAMYGGRVWWTEYRRSKLFEQRVNSQLCYMDLERGTARTFVGRRNALYPTPAPGELAWVAYKSKKFSGIYVSVAILMFIDCGNNLRFLNSFIRSYAAVKIIVLSKFKKRVNSVLTY